MADETFFWNVPCVVEHRSIVVIEAATEQEARQKFEAMDWYDDTEQEIINWTITGKLRKEQD